MIRKASVEDTVQIMELVSSSGLFQTTEIKEIAEILSSNFTTESSDYWFVYDDNGISGMAYCSLEQMTDRVWNLLMLLVKTENQCKGIGTALVAYTKFILKNEGQRMLIVETSGTTDFENTRRFYVKCGFNPVARIPDFYMSGDDKII